MRGSHGWEARDNGHRSLEICPSHSKCASFIAPILCVVLSNRTFYKDGHIAIDSEKNFFDLDKDTAICFAAVHSDKIIKKTIEEKLDFSLIGILAKISDILAKNKIGIFVISTYNTDIILVKKEQLLEAVVALKQAGYQFL